MSVLVLSCVGLVPIEKKVFFLKFVNVIAQLKPIQPVPTLV